VVTLHDIAGLDIAEIAEIVGTKEATVRTRLRDGRRKLAQLLKSDEYFGPTLDWSAP
jgi:DNA-directed RNA polymerase specialized sigma24 family protein